MSREPRRHSDPYQYVATGVPSGEDLTPDWKTERELRLVDGNNDQFCVGCGGFGKYFHEPDPTDTVIRFREYEYKLPFFCLCCGIQICARQFAYGRNCGYCDTGQCHRDRIKAFV